MKVINESNSPSTFAVSFNQSMEKQVNKIDYIFNSASFLKNNIIGCLSVERVVIKPTETYFSQFRNDSKWLRLLSLFQGNNLKREYPVLLQAGYYSSTIIMSVTKIVRIEINISYGDDIDFIQKSLAIFLTKELLTDWFVIDLESFELTISNDIIQSKEKKDILNQVGFLNLEDESVLIGSMHTFNQSIQREKDSFLSIPSIASISSSKCKNQLDISGLNTNTESIDNFSNNVFEL